MPFNERRIIPENVAEEEGGETKEPVTSAYCEQLIVQVLPELGEAEAEALAKERRETPSPQKKDSEPSFSELWDDVGMGLHEDMQYFLIRDTYPEMSSQDAAKMAADLTWRDYQEAKKRHEEEDK